MGESSPFLIHNDRAGVVIAPHSSTWAVAAPEPPGRLEPEGTIGANGSRSGQLCRILNGEDQGERRGLFPRRIWLQTGDVHATRSHEYAGCRRSGRPFAAMGLGRAAADSRRDRPLAAI